MTLSRTFVLFIAGLLLFGTMVCADVTAHDIEKSLTKNLRHPYLYFNKEEKAALHERIQTDPECRDFMPRMLAEANRLLYTPVDPLAPVRVKNARFEASYEFENYLLNNTRSSYDLALVYQMTGDEKYARKAFEFIDVVCDQPTWVHGAHEFPIIYDRVWPWGAKDDQVVFSYAQWSDHIVLQIAAIYDWLYDALDKRQRDRIRGALLEKAILRVRGNYEYHWWAAAYRCNWCAVCNASLGVASMALLTEDPQLTDVIAESYNRISRTLDEVRDGGWQEGIGYLNYAISTSLEFADVLKRVTDSRYNLYEHPRFADAVKTFIYCQIQPGKSVHFGDSGGGKFGSYAMFNDLMVETGDRYAAWLRKNWTDDMPSNLLDCIKPKSTLEPAVPQETSIHFPAVDWVVMRSDFTNPKNVVVAGKCGLNNDPHHGHLDAGHFSLYWNGCEFICDHGSAGYDKAYFDEERWNYPLASSISHNVVLVNGEKQIPGKRKNQPWDLTVGGRIIEFRPGKNRDYTLMDPTKAYPGKEMKSCEAALKSWRRNIILEKPVITVVLDEVTSAKGAEIEVRFHSAAEYTIVDKYVNLKSDKDIMAVIPVVDGSYTIRPGKHAIMMAQRNATFRWVPYFGTVMKATKERTVIATLILPVDDDREAEGILKSAKRTEDDHGNLTLSFTKKGETFTYIFKKGVDGLVLD